MKITDTISVNPSKTALGHVDTPASSIFRSQIIGAEVENRSVDLLKILFPTMGSGVAEYKKYEVPLRTLFATLLIVMGITLIETSMSAGLAICSLCFGGLLAIGLLTRPVMLGAAIYYCVSGALALRSGNVDMTVFALMFGCLIFSVTGAGKYSLDTLIRSAIIRHQKSVVRKHKENFMGYKAFHNVKF